MTDNRRSYSLRELLRDLPVRVFSQIEDVQVTGIASDSRLVKVGDLFVAVSGESTDGHRYIPDAVRRGAAAVVGMQSVSGAGVPYVQVEDSRQVLPYLAAAYFDNPGRKLTVIGVTGTDGKTTTSNMIYHILQAAGIRAGMISTVNAVIGNQVLDTGFHVTTPDPLEVQGYLAEMVSAGLTHVVLEATSHGLAQHRVDASEFDIAVVTNITHEHLDYHGTYEEYRAAKARLFTSLATSYRKDINPPRGAVLNRDDSSFDYLASVSPIPPVTYGFHPAAHLRAEQVVEREDGLAFTIIGPNISLPVTTHLRGKFNVSNCLAAAAACLLVIGLDASAVKAGLASLEGVPGRMEKFDEGQPFTAIVDFAHTPYALQAALEAGRALAGEAGRVIAVFGSAGLRDRAKRRMMAETSAKLADLTILTAEDPRTESLEDILAEMAEGARASGGVEGATFWRIPDRGEAIRFAVSLARPGDVVMACGKGHEQSMCFGTTEYAWDDRTAMQAALGALMGKPGPQMPFLPTRNTPE